MGRKARLDLVLDCADPQKLGAFWRDALGYRVYFESATHVILVPDDAGGNASPLVLQQVPEPKTAKNRMHIDIVADDVVTEVERLELLGARRLHEGIRTSERSSGSRSRTRNTTSSVSAQASSGEPTRSQPPAIHRAPTDPRDASRINRLFEAHELTRPTGSFRPCGPPRPPAAAGSPPSPPTATSTRLALVTKAAVGRGPFLL
jgi:hypothetical protein